MHIDPDARSAERSPNQPHAFVEDIATSWASYLDAVAAVIAAAPAGLLLHLAGPTDEGVRIIEVWESRDSGQRFRHEALEDAINRVTDVGVSSGYRQLDVRHASGAWTAAPENQDFRDRIQPRKEPQ